jgi:hypothetical protein
VAGFGVTPTGWFYPDPWQFCQLWLVAPGIDVPTELHPGHSAEDAFDHSAGCFQLFVFSLGHISRDIETRLN